MATMSKTKLQTFINGEFVDSATGETEEVTNPANGEVIPDMPLSSEEDVNRAVAAAKAAFPAWAATTPAERASAMLKLADILDEHAEEIADLEAADAGKPRNAFLEDEMPAVSDTLRFFAGAGRVPEGQASGEYVENRTSIIRREPAGVVGQIAPWNYPLMMAAWKIGPALAAGNTVVLKPSELTPLTALRLAELSADILPPGVLNVVTGRGETAGVPLVEHPGVAMVSLTGSVPTGQAVMRAAATTLKRVHLELGGKAPVVVLDDADPEVVAAAVRLGGYFNAGQDCTAACRVIASGGAYDSAVEGIAEAVKTLVSGTPSDEGTELGPLVSAEQRDRVAGFVD